MPATRYAVTVYYLTGGFTSETCTRTNLTATLWKAEKETRRAVAFAVVKSLHADRVVAVAKKMATGFSVSAYVDA